MENSRIPGEHFFTTSDNTALFYRHWPALQPGAKKVIVLFHRGHEHSGRDEKSGRCGAFAAKD